MMLIEAFSSIPATFCRYLCGLCYFRTWVIHKDDTALRFLSSLLDVHPSDQNHPMALGQNPDNLWGVSLLTAHLKRRQSKLTQARAKVGADSSSCLGSNPTFMTLPAAKHQADPTQWRIDRAGLLPLAKFSAFLDIRQSDALQHKGSKWCFVERRHFADKLTYSYENKFSHMVF